MALKKSLLDEPKYDKQCAWNDLGYRCQGDGHMSQGINGNGPWYCRAHFADLTKRERWVVPKDDPGLSDRYANALVPRLEGESEHDWSMRCRDWVLAKLKSKNFMKPMDEDLEEAA